MSSLHPIEARDRKTGEVFTYLPDKVIGGGWAQIYLAQRTAAETADEEQFLGRVALKVASAPKSKGLLIQEAELLTLVAKSASTRGSRIVRIGRHGHVLERVGTDDILLELEYLDGRTVSAWYEKDWKKADCTALETVERAIGIVRQIFEALVELAEVPGGIIHRDIKPDNIMLTSTGLRLFDFNVARQAAEAKTYVGTGHYMAPEIQLGHDYDHRADLYSLGVILYELLFRTAPALSHAERASGTFEAPWIADRLPDLQSLVATPLRELVAGLVCPLDRRLQNAEAALEVLDRVVKALGDQFRATHPPTSAAAILPKLDLIQLLFELRPSGLNAVVADGEETGPLQKLMRKRLRVHDPLEDWLAKRVEQAADSGQPLVVVLAGNAGDGKSHLIDRLMRDRFGTKTRLKEKIRYIADATHADLPTQSQQDRLEDFFSPLAKGSELPSKPVSIIAMNTGMVIRFFETAAERHNAGESECGDLSVLYSALRNRLGLSRKQSPELPFDLVVINLDLRDPLKRTTDSQSFFESMLDRLDPEGDTSILHETWPRCDACPALNLCPVHYNVEALRLPRVRRTLMSVLERASLDPEVHLSPRLLWGFLYRIITGGQERYDMSSAQMGPCDVVRESLHDRQWLFDGHFTEVLFRARAGDDHPVWPALRAVDPAYSPAPAIDQLHTRLNVLKYEDDSATEMKMLGGGAGVLAGLHLDQLLSEIVRTEQRRDAAIRRRVFFHPASCDAFLAWGEHTSFRRLLDAYATYSARCEPADLTAEQKATLKQLSEMVAQVFLRGCGRRIGRNNYLRVSQPHPASESQLLVAVDDESFRKHFNARSLLVEDIHVVAHRGREKLLSELGYRPRMVQLSLASKRLLIDFELYEFLRQVREGRQPSKRDLAQFEALLFVGEQLGNDLVQKQPGMALYVLHEPTHEFHKLYRDDFGTLIMASEVVDAR